MASIEFLTKRVEGKKAELKKLTAKMERIEKAQATNWEVNPYYYDELEWNGVKVYPEFPTRTIKEETKFDIYGIDITDIINEIDYVSKMTIIKNQVNKLKKGF